MTADTKIVLGLCEILDKERVRADPEARMQHTADASWIARYRLHAELPLPQPDVVVWPNTASEVGALIRFASEHRVPVVVRGGGSGVQGGTLAMAGGIGVDMTQLNKVVSVDIENMTVTAEAGVTGPVLAEALAPHGLMCAHDPGSFWRNATVGGWVAARGAGVTSTKYGKAEDMVVSMDVVVPSGELVHMPSMPSHAVGPGLLPLFIGSEGVLGIITQVTLRVDPIPSAREFLAYTFATVTEGLAACRAITQARLKVAVMRLYDAEASKGLANVLDAPLEGILLLVVCDGDERLTTVEAAMAGEICRRAGGTVGEAQACEAWWERRYVPHSVEKSPRPPLVYSTTDICAPFGSLEKIYEARKRLIHTEFAAVGARYRAHFSHWYPTGGMIYDRFYVDSPPDAPRDVIKLHQQMVRALTQVALQEGAVINDHHGIGRQLHAFVRDQYGSAFPVLTSIKNALDPSGIMNPGKLGFETALGSAASGIDDYDGL